MKTNNTIAFSPLTNDETKQLTTDVKETIAFNFKSQKTFTSADLWRIQRNKKSFNTRRYFA